MPDLIKWGSITAAGDVTTTALVNSLTSQTRQAILGLTRRVVSATGDWTDLNSVDSSHSVWLDILSSALNRPDSAAWRALGIHIPNTGGGAVQIVTYTGSSTQTDTRMYFRARTSGGTWLPWTRTVTSVMLDQRVAGLINELNLATIQRCVHRENGAWVYDLPATRHLSTHYLIPDHDGIPTVRETPFPTPSATVPGLNW